MNKKLYVGNLPYSITEEELKTTFSPCGGVESARIIIDKMSGRSKGFAFVEMANDEGAQRAVTEMNGKDVGGRKLIVSEARPEQPRSPGGPGGPRSFDNGRGRGGGGGGGGGYGGDRAPRQGQDRGRGPRDGGNGYGPPPMDPPQNTKRDSKDRRHTASDDDDDDNRWNR